jgi:malate dehydrogenase
MIPCSVLLEGEYGLKDICIGVPCIIGSKGVESIVDIKLNEKEKQQMIESANKVTAMNTTLKGIL